MHSKTYIEGDNGQSVRIRMYNIVVSVSLTKPHVVSQMSKYLCVCVCVWGGGGGEGGLLLLLLLLLLLFFLGGWGREGLVLAAAHISIHSWLCPRRRRFCSERFRSRRTAVPPVSRPSTFRRLARCSFQAVKRTIGRPQRRPPPSRCRAAWRCTCPDGVQYKENRNRWIERTDKLKV